MGDEEFFGSSSTTLSISLLFARKVHKMEFKRMKFVNTQYTITPSVFLPLSRSLSSFVCACFVLFFSLLPLPLYFFFVLRKCVRESINSLGCFAIHKFDGSARRLQLHLIYMKCVSFPFSFSLYAFRAAKWFR